LQSFLRLNGPDVATFCSPGTEGYTDYPKLKASAELAA
jgi:hypothetical protein